MGRRAKGLLALVFAAAAVAPSMARAQVVAATAPPPAPVPRWDPDRVNQLDANTARLIGARRIKLGVLSFDLGLLSWLSIGTDPPAWAIRAIRPPLVPNLHLKVALLRTDFLAISGQVAGYYADISTTRANGHLLALPFTLLATVPIGARTWVHLEGAYNWLRGFGAGDESRAEIRGAVVARTIQVGAMVEVRVSRVVALLARGRYQVDESPIILSGGGQVDAYTHVQLDAQVRTSVQHPAMGIAGLACTWSHFGFVAGGGYGHYFVPGANVALAYRGFVPEASLWAVF
jgi:hypothetical protein